MKTQLSLCGNFSTFSYGEEEREEEAEEAEEVEEAEKAEEVNPRPKNGQGLLHFSRNIHDCSVCK